MLRIGKTRGSQIPFRYGEFITFLRGMLHVFRPLEYTSRDIWRMEHDKTWSVVATGRVKRFGAEVNRVKYELGMALLWCLCSTSRSMRQRSSFWEGRSSTPRSSITSGATKPSGVQGCPGVREGESTMTMPCESYWKDTVNQQRRKACSGSCLNMANHFFAVSTRRIFCSMARTNGELPAPAKPGSSAWRP